MEHRGLPNKFSYRILTVFDFLKTQCHPTVVKLYRSLPLEPWGLTTRGYCSAAQQSLARDEESFPYHAEDGSLLSSSFTQSDFLFIPTKHPEEFAKLASLFLKYRVIHKCAWGTIVDMLRQKQNATVRLTYLCTSWGPKRRGKRPLIERCMRDRVNYGVFHPYKIGYEENAMVVQNQGLNQEFQTQLHDIQVMTYLASLAKTTGAVAAYTEKFRTVSQNRNDLSSSTSLQQSDVVRPYGGGSGRESSSAAISAMGFGMGGGFGE